LEQDEVSPRTSQLADLGHATRFEEPGASVEAQRALVLGVDAGDHDVGAAISQRRFRHIKQATPDAASERVPANMDRVLCMTSL
jgi:hypothetical protein